jgi:hypothetical protein
MKEVIIQPKTPEELYREKVDNINKEIKAVLDKYNASFQVIPNYILDIKFKQYENNEEKPL